MYPNTFYDFENLFRIPAKSFQKFVGKIQGNMVRDTYMYRIELYLQYIDVRYFALFFSIFGYRSR